MAIPSSRPDRERDKFQEDVNGDVAVNVIPTRDSQGDSLFDIQFTLRVDNEIDPDVIYIGEALPSSLDSAPVWRIKKIDLLNPISIKYADGNTNFDNIWDNRAGLTYV